MNSSTNSQDSTDQGEAEQRGAGDGGIPPGDWLLQGENDEDVYKIKHMKGVQITRLPNDATSCRKWRAAFLAAVSRIDLTNRDVLVKFCVHCMEDEAASSDRTCNHQLLFPCSTSMLLQSSLSLRSSQRTLIWHMS